MRLGVDPVDDNLRCGLVRPVEVICPGDVLGGESVVSIGYLDSRVAICIVQVVVSFTVVEVKLTLCLFVVVQVNFKPHLVLEALEEGEAALML